MRIIADQAIPFAQEAFSPLGEVRLCPGRSIDRAVAAEADVLIIRSITPVDAKLLAGTRVRLVGTATIGTDHVDADYLAGAGIRFISAAGSNANSVAEYVVAALLHVAEKKGVLLSGQTIGVVGVGNVGTKVAEKCRALGMAVLLNDPPRQRAEGGQHWCDLGTLLAESDAVTLHTPLERGGTDPTVHLLDGRRLAMMKPGALLINTSRGAVIDEAELIEALSAGAGPGGAVLDVWETEPGISVKLLEHVLLGTAHIAGYSLDGKVAATEMMHRAVCDFAGIEPVWRPTLPPPAVRRIQFPDSDQGTEQGRLEMLVRSVYDITADDARLRAVAGAPPEEATAIFDRLRKTYPVRREFRFTQVTGDGLAASLLEVLRGLGFSVLAEGSSS